MTSSTESDPNQIVEQFEQIWGDGSPPEIKDFLPDGTSRKQVLIELIMVDMEHRWRRISPDASVAATVLVSEPTDGMLPDRPQLEDYVSHYVDLGPLVELPAELIAHECLVRHRWGDQPSIEEYSDRFAPICSELAETLESVVRQAKTSDTVSLKGSPFNSTVIGLPRRLSPAPQPDGVLIEKFVFGEYEIQA
ncbi:MAG: hypothetical protein ABGZ53_04050, partial [Fuerstiella sp.]